MAGLWLLGLGVAVLAILIVRYYKWRTRRSLPAAGSVLFPTVGAHLSPVEACHELPRKHALLDDPVCTYTKLRRKKTRRKPDSAAGAGNVVVPNWASVWHLLDHGQQVLARLFRERWQILTRGDWTPGAPAARAFFAKKGPHQGEGWRAWQAANPAQRVQLMAGATERWDISLLCLVLQHSAWSSVPPGAEKKAIDALRKARNAVAHTLPSQLAAQKASNLLQGVVASLVALGETKAELDRFLLDKQRGVVSSLGGARAAHQASEEVLAKAKHLKEEANKKHQAGRFDEAIKLYTEALALPLLSKEELAVLHSNRSAAHLADGDLSSALQDGKEAQRLRPTWPKGYFRKGQVLLLQRNWPKALKAFEWAFALDPTNKELRQRVAECKKEIEMQDRFEHFNAQYLPPSEEAVESQLATRFGQPTGFFNGGRETMIKMFRDMNELGRAYVLEAHTYMMQPKLDYAKAARLFQLGVDHGSPEAMYNLAVLYQKGLGVEKSLQKSETLLNQAVTHPPMDKLTSLRNIGVADAQHALGKAYLDGLFGEKSLDKALTLIRRAADADYPPALNSLGALYESGRHGEAKNEKQAHEYYLAAAARGETVAMHNLACLYARGAAGVPQDLTKAKTWASRSVENGNWAAQSTLEQLQRIEQNREQADRHNLALLDTIPDTHERQSMERVLAERAQLMRKVESFDATPTTLSPDPLELLARADTSPTATKDLQLRMALVAAMDQLKGLMGSRDLAELADLLSSVAQVYKAANFLPRFPPAQRDRLVAAAERVIKGNPSHEGARVVWAGLHFYEGWAPAYLQQCCYDFPTSPFFWKLHGWRLAEDRKWVEAAHKYSKALQLSPDDLDAIYSLAAVRLNTKGESREKQVETIGLYQQFLSRCEPDHPKAPEAHYGVGCLYMLLDDMENAGKHYQLGLEAEKRQLPMFLPYKSLNRDGLAYAVNLRQMTAATTAPRGSVRPSTEDHPFVATGMRNADLSPADISTASSSSGSGGGTTTDQAGVVDVRRRQIRLRQREVVRSSRDIRQPGTTTKSTTIAAPPKRQQAKKQPSGGGPTRTILISDMDPTRDKVYNGCVIQGTIIELPALMFSLITVMQDAAGRVERLALYNLPKGLSSAITIGQQIAITNPYMRMAQDGRPMIRVDDPASVQLLAKVAICHFCAKQASKLLCCGTCRTARYCSKECQVSDWKELNHTAVCFTE